MSEENAFYLTSVSHGLVLAHSPNGVVSGVVAQNKGDQDQAQKWTVEYGDEPDTVALRCCGNGEYLHANGGGAWATVGTGAKQWWKISSDKVTPPHACRLSPVEFPNVYLNHFQGLFVHKKHPGMKVHMWVWSPPEEYCLAWYFMDAAGGFNPKGTASISDSTQAKEVEAQLEDLQQREAALTEKEQAASARTAELDKLRDQLEADRAESAKQNGKAKPQSSQDEKDKQADLQGKLDELRAAERDLASKEATVDKKKEQGKAKEKNLKARQAALDTQSQSIEAKEAELKKREEQLASAPANGGPTESELLKVENENLKLQLKVKKLEDQLKASKLQAPKTKSALPEAAAPQPSAAGSKGVSTGAATNGNKLTNGDATSSLTDAKTRGKEDLSTGTAAHHDEPTKPVEFPCGHKVFPPPRKLRRRLVGLLYE